ncbi:hypothetical protein AB0D13_42095, partial [Streptomyces sp. NPDC048430]|uniref:hypothetical protein n=1 Tax=Streptomyces sp. NPDC048430 TaxID=3155388 RepID=UPI00341CA7B9
GDPAAERVQQYVLPELAVTVAVGVGDRSASVALEFAPVPKLSKSPDMNSAPLLIEYDRQLHADRV